VSLDGEVLEIGPGYGVATRWLAQRTDRLTAIEVDPALAAALRVEFAGRVEVRHGDGAALPFADASFDAVRFRLVHIGDTMVVVDPDRLPDRLRLAGLTAARVELGSRSLRFTATRRLQ
jgi:16S rRNA A1518/A1519 N6-dimethyltransferase RsmA/KsgA/DIM1 with predicted DNA glycosylase/AP lyase activity